MIPTELRDTTISSEGEPEKVDDVKIPDEQRKMWEAMEAQAAEEQFQRTGRWHTGIKFSDLEGKGRWKQFIYLLSCCNCAYKCSGDDGNEHCYACGKDHCSGNDDSYLCCCFCLCCCLGFWPHLVRQSAGVDYADFFGGPNFQRGYTLDVQKPKWQNQSHEEHSL